MKLKTLVIIVTLNFSVSSHSHIVGYGSADSVLPAKNQEAFFTGFQLGFKEIIGEIKAKDSLVSEQIINGSTSGALKALKTLKDKDVKMIVGFPTSHEALQVAKITSKEGYLTIFSSAGHSSLSNFGPTIFTTGESMTTYIAETVNLIKNRFKGQLGIFIYNPQAVFSVNQKEEFQKFLSNSKASAPDFTFIALNNKQKIEADGISKLKSGKYQYIFLSPYADESAAVMSQLDAEKIDFPIITNSSWTTGDIEFIRRFISEKKTPIITGAVWVPGMPTSKHFEKLFSTTYGSPPSAESASGYDLGIIVGTVISRVKNKNYTKESILKAFHLNRCFEKTTVGKICFPENGGHSSKPIHFMQLTKLGLKNL